MRVVSRLFPKPIAEMSVGARAGEGEPRSARSLLARSQSVEIVATTSRYGIRASEQVDALATEHNSPSSLSTGVARLAGAADISDLFLAGVG